MQIFSIETGVFKCDGGAMFGVVPKFMWQNKYPVDKNNLCNCALRSLLIVDGDRRILIDNGIGDKLSEYEAKLNSYSSNVSLKKSLNELSFNCEDITDVIFTHLHFDHCGGTTQYKKGTKDLELVFPNAIHWVSKKQWDNYLNPNIREGDSYYPENMMLVFELGKLKFIKEDGELFPNVEIRMFNGHTIGLVAVLVKRENQIITFIGDFIPTVANINLKWIAAYDLFPCQVLEEKEAFLLEAVDKNYTLFFQHDIQNECCSLKQTERGVKPDNIFRLKSLF